MNTYGYVGGNPVRYTDPLGLFVNLLVPAATGLSVESGVLNTVGGLFVITQGMRASSSSNGSNIFNFPGNTSTKVGQCGPEDDDPEDPCERDRRFLQSQRDLLMNSLKTVKDKRNIVRIMKDYAKFFNPLVEAHNTVCPRHTVEPIIPRFTL